MTEVVRVEIRPGKALALGLMVACFAGVFWIVGLNALVRVGAAAFITWLVLFTALATTPVAVILIGIAVRRPVALRMDVQGISGFYACPATWSEIARIGVAAGPKGQRSLGFALRDPVAFRDRQTPFRRFISWLNGRVGGYHIAVPHVILKDADLEDLARRARAFHAAAGGSDDPTAS